MHDMTRARKHLVCLSDTPYYHVTSRCVRRAFLCGKDKVTGKNYEHRRQWIEDRIRVLSSLFSIDLCAYAVMSNHYHLVVRINTEEGNDWSDDEVLGRWTALFRGPLIVQQYRNGQALTVPEQETIKSIIAIYRSRLQSLSWFMKCLNEPISRKANAEDGCTGHFWEARFHSEALRSYQALIAAMAYVDLNPIRATMARSLKGSDHTSIKARIETFNQTAETASNNSTQTRSQLAAASHLFHFDQAIKPLAAFAGALLHSANNTQTGKQLPIYRTEYFRLVDTTGRILVHGKRGRIDPELKPILSRLSMSSEQWVQVSSNFRRFFRRGYLNINSAA